MNCETCKENQIKYNNNCFDFANSSIKSFYYPENNNTYNATSCFEKFGLYIKDDSNECIPLPKIEEGYFISNDKTGLLSKCHINCFSCNNSPIKDYLGNLQSMECITCKDYNSSQKTMIKIDNNCFNIIQYDESKIIFNISEMQQDILGTCLFFKKAIYYDNYECIDKPNNTYYILDSSDENTGVIKNCSEACDTCLGEGNNQNTNCIQCAQGYFKTEESYTHCLKKDLISLDDYYLNTSDDIFYHCHHNCKGCNNSYNPLTGDMYCLNCINDYYFIYGENKCYNFTLLTGNKYYFNANDSKFHKCYYTCSECLNFEPNETNHFCIKCISRYYFIENTNNCYNKSISEQGYYLDNSYIGEGRKLFKKCYKSCKTCEWGIILNSSTNEENHNCKECADNYYRLENDSYSNNCYDNETINTLKDLKNNLNNLFDSDITENDIINQIRNDIASYVNSSKVINGSNFLAVVLSSDNMNPEEQLKNGISAVDLGNCTNVIKEFYNIPKEENLIILNMETKNESNNNADKSFNLGKNTQIEIYDYSGRKLNLSVCKEDIKVMKYIGDIEGQLDMDSAKSLSNQGIDVFNANDKFFNDICHPYENSDGKDIVLNDRRNELYQDAKFCQDGCTYNGINYILKAANCICNSSLLQVEENKTNIEKESKENKFQSLTESFISNLIDFNFDVLRCYNLALNTKILIHNIGFYCLSFMFVLQIIFFFVYLIKKVKPLKTFMLIFQINNMNNYQNEKILKNNIEATPPPKHNTIKITEKENNDNKENKRKKYIKGKFNIKEKYILNKTKDNLNIPKFSKAEIDSNKTIIVSNNFVPNINIKNPIINIKNNSNEVNNIDKDNNEKIYNIKSIKKNIFDKKLKEKNNIKNIFKLKTMQGKNINYNIKSKNNNINIIKLSKTDSDIQDLDYEEAIIYDKRSYFRMYWGFLIDSQIILGTFCTENNLDLFVIKLSFLVFTFQISFFLNALFYTDEYISNAYHNDGVLDFFSGLPKSIYSFFATLITTNLLRMLSSSKNELMRVIKRNGRFQHYINIINVKLVKLQKKLIVYFIIIFLLESFFLYYVTVFCAVYRHSQKYWFIGCLESFAIDSFVALIICIFLALFRYISIKTHIKYFYIVANIINTFL